MGILAKMSKVFQGLGFLAIIILFIEMVMLFSQIDLVPFIIIGLVCGLSIILRNSSEDFFNNENTIKDTGLVFRFVFVAIVDILLFSCFMVLGIENIANWISFLFHNYKIVRFAFYGLICPIITSYFMTWFWTDNKPNLSILYAIVMPNSMGAFYKILFVNLLVGIFICVCWSDYFNIVNGLLKFF